MLHIGAKSGAAARGLGSGHAAAAHLGSTAGSRAAWLKLTATAPTAAPSSASATQCRRNCPAAQALMQEQASAGIEPGPGEPAASNSQSPDLQEVAAALLALCRAAADLMRTPGTEGLTAAGKEGGEAGPAGAAGQELGEMGGHVGWCLRSMEQQLEAAEPASAQASRPVTAHSPRAKPGQNKGQGATFPCPPKAAMAAVRRWGLEDWTRVLKSSRKLGLRPGLHMQCLALHVLAKRLQGASAQEKAGILPETVAQLVLEVCHLAKPASTGASWASSPAAAAAAAAVAEAAAAAADMPQWEQQQLRERQGSHAEASSSAEAQGGAESSKSQRSKAGGGPHGGSSAQTHAGSTSSTSSALASQLEVVRTAWLAQACAWLEPHLVRSLPPPLLLKLLRAVVTVYPRPWLRTSFWTALFSQTCERAATATPDEDAGGQDPAGKDGSSSSSSSSRRSRAGDSLGQDSVLACLEPSQLQQLVWCVSQGLGFMKTARPPGSWLKHLDWRLQAVCKLDQDGADPLPALLCVTSVTVSLAHMGSTPSPQLLAAVTAFTQAAAQAGVLPAATFAELLWAFAKLGWHPGAAWLQATAQVVESSVSTPTAAKISSSGGSRAGAAALPPTKLCQALWGLATLANEFKVMPGLAEAGAGVAATRTAADGLDPWGGQAGREAAVTAWLRVAVPLLGPALPSLQHGASLGSLAWSISKLVPCAPGLWQGGQAGSAGSGGPGGSKSSSGNDGGSRTASSEEQQPEGAQLLGSFCMALAAACTRQAAVTSPHSAVLSLWSLSRLSHWYHLAALPSWQPSLAALASAVAGRTASQLHALDAEHFASLVDGLGKLGWRGSPTWTAAVLETARRHVSSMGSPVVLANLLHGMHAVLRPAQQLHALSPEAHHALADLLSVCLPTANRYFVAVLGAGGGASASAASASGAQQRAGAGASDRTPLGYEDAEEDAGLEGAWFVDGRAGSSFAEAAACSRLRTTAGLAQACAGLMRTLAASCSALASSSAAGAAGPNAAAAVGPLNPRVVCSAVLSFERDVEGLAQQLLGGTELAQGSKGFLATPAQTFTTHYATLAALGGVADVRAAASELLAGMAAEQSAQATRAAVTAPVRRHSSAATASPRAGAAGTSSTTTGSREGAAGQVSSSPGLQRPTRTPEQAWGDAASTQLLLPAQQLPAVPQGLRGALEQASGVGHLARMLVQAPHAERVPCMVHVLCMHAAWGVLPGPGLLEAILAELRILGSEAAGRAAAGLPAPSTSRQGLPSQVLEALVQLQAHLAADAHAASAASPAVPDLLADCAQAATRWVGAVSAATGMTERQQTRSGAGALGSAGEGRAAGLGPAALAQLLEAQAQRIEAGELRGWQAADLLQSLPNLPLLRSLVLPLPRPAPEAAGGTGAQGAVSGSGITGAAQWPPQRDPAVAAQPPRSRLFAQIEEGVVSRGGLTPRPAPGPSPVPPSGSAARAPKANELAALQAAALRFMQALWGSSGSGRAQAGADAGVSGWLEGMVPQDVARSVHALGRLGWRPPPAMQAVLLAHMGTWCSGSSDSTDSSISSGGSGGHGDGDGHTAQEEHEAPPAFPGLGFKDASRLLWGLASLGIALPSVQWWQACCAQLGEAVLQEAAARSGGGRGDRSSRSGQSQPSARVVAMAWRAVPPGALTSLLWTLAKLQQQLAKHQASGSSSSRSNEGNAFPLPPWLPAVAWALGQPSALPTLTPSELCCILWACSRLRQGLPQPHKQRQGGGRQRGASARDKQGGSARAILFPLHVLQGRVQKELQRQLHLLYMAGGAPVDGSPTPKRAATPRGQQPQLQPQAQVQVQQPQAPAFADLLVACSSYAQYRRTLSKSGRAAGSGSLLPMGLLVALTQGMRHASPRQAVLCMQVLAEAKQQPPRALRGALYARLVPELQQYASKEKVVQPQPGVAAASGAAAGSDRSSSAGTSAGSATASLAAEDIYLLCLSLVKLRVSPPPFTLLPHLARAAIAAMPRLSPTAMATTTWALARFEAVVEGPAAAVLLNQTARHLRARALRPRHLVNLLDGLARLSAQQQWRPAAPLLSAHCAALHDALPRLTADDVASVVLALARMDYRPDPALMEGLVARSQATLRRASPRALSTLLYGLAALGYRPPATWFVLFFRVTRPMLLRPTSATAGSGIPLAPRRLRGPAATREGSSSDSGGGDAEQGGGSAARKAAASAAGLALSQPGAARVLHGRTLARLVWALATLRKPPPEQWLSLCMWRALHALPRCSAHDLTLLALGCTLLGPRLPPRWMAAFGTAVRLQPMESGPHGLQGQVNLMWAWQRLQERMALDDEAGGQRPGVGSSGRGAGSMGSVDGDGRRVGPGQRLTLLRRGVARRRLAAVGKGAGRTGAARARQLRGWGDYYGDEDVDAEAEGDV